MNPGDSLPADAWEAAPRAGETLPADAWEKPARSAKDFGDTAKITASGLAKGLNRGLNPISWLGDIASVLDFASPVINPAGWAAARTQAKVRENAGMPPEKSGLGQIADWASRNEGITSPMRAVGPFADWAAGQLGPMIYGSNWKPKLQGSEVIDPKRVAAVSGVEKMTPLQRNLAGGAEILGNIAPLGKAAAVKSGLGAFGLGYGVESLTGSEQWGDIARAVGAIGGPIGYTAAKNIATRAANPAPTILERQTQAKTAYATAPDVALSGDASLRARNQVANMLADNNFIPQSYPKTKAALSVVEDYAGQPMTWKRADAVHDAIRDVPFAGAMPSAKDARMAKNVLATWDRAMQNPLPGHVRGDLQAAVSATKEGDKLWSMARKAEKVQEAINMAHKAASGFENGIRVEFRKLVSNKPFMNSLQAHERKAIWDVVHGKTSANVIRGLKGFGSIHIPGWTPMMKGTAANITGRQADAVVDLITRGFALPKASPAQSGALGLLGYLRQQEAQ